MDSNMTHGASTAHARSKNHQAQQLIFTAIPETESEMGSHQASLNDSMSRGQMRRSSTTASSELVTGVPTATAMASNQGGFPTSVSSDLNQSRDSVTSDGGRRNVRRRSSIGALQTNLTVSSSNTGAEILSQASEGNGTACRNGGSSVRRRSTSLDRSDSKQSVPSGSFIKSSSTTHSRNDSRRVPSSQGANNAVSRRARLMGKRRPLISTAAELEERCINSIDKDPQPVGSSDSLQYNPPSTFQLHNTTSSRRGSRRTSSLDGFAEAMNSGAPHPNPFASTNTKKSRTGLQTDIIHSIDHFRISVNIIDAFRKAEQETQVVLPAHNVPPRPFSGATRRRSSLITVERIIADREEEARRFVKNDNPRRDVETQTDSGITDFETLDGIYLALRDELEITEGMLEINQRHHIRIATTDMYNRVGNQIMRMEQQYRASLHHVRQACHVRHQEAIKKVQKDHDRYTNWIVTETEEKLATQKATLEAIHDNALKELRKKDEELERLHHSCSRLYAVMVRHGVLGDDETGVAESEKTKSDQLVTWYESRLSERDEKIKMLRNDLLRLEALHNKFDMAVSKPVTGERVGFAYQEPGGVGAMKSHRMSRAGSAGSRFHDMMSPGNINMMGGSFFDNYLDEAEEPEPVVDPEEALAEQLTAHYEDQLNKLDISNSQELVSLNQRKERVLAAWKIKTRSAEKFRNESGTLKVLRRQDRIFDLMRKNNKPRPPRDNTVTAHLWGMTLQMLKEKEIAEAAAREREREIAERARAEIERVAEIKRAIDERRRLAKSVEVQEEHVDTDDAMSSQPGTHDHGTETDAQSSQHASLGPPSRGKRNEMSTPSPNSFAQGGNSHNTAMHGIGTFKSGMSNTSNTSKPKSKQGFNFFGTMAAKAIASKAIKRFRQQQTQPRSFPVINPLKNQSIDGMSIVSSSAAMSDRSAASRAKTVDGTVTVRHDSMT